MFFMPYYSAEEDEAANFVGLKVGDKIKKKRKDVKMILRNVQKAG